MATFLVTGAVGFIGTNLCHRLLQDGHNVIGLDNFSTCREQNFDDLRRMWSPARFRLVVHDIREPLGDVYQPIGGIFHLACPASPPKYGRDKIATIQTAVTGTDRVLQLAADTGARVVMTSTSEIYGEPLRHPQTEIDWSHVNPIGPRTCYDGGKIVAEALALAYAEQRNIDVRIARVFNTFGPAMAPDDGRAVSNFIVAALQEKPITIYGDGSHTRSFCYIGDLVDGLVKLYELQANTPLTVNLGNPRELSVHYLARVVRRRVADRGYPIAPIVYGHPVRDEPTRRCPSIDRAIDWLDWRPTTDIDAGIDRTIDYFVNVLGLNDRKVSA